MEEEKHDLAQSQPSVFSLLEPDSELSSWGALQQLTVRGRPHGRRPPGLKGKKKKKKKAGEPARLCALARAPRVTILVCRPPTPGESYEETPSLCVRGKATNRKSFVAKKTPMFFFVFGCVCLKAERGNRAGFFLESAAGIKLQMFAPDKARKCAHTCACVCVCVSVCLSLSLPPPLSASCRVSRWLLSSRHSGP